MLVVSAEAEGSVWTFTYNNAYTVVNMVLLQWGTPPTAPGTLGIYQPCNWARLAGEHTGFITTERNHIYHLYTFIEISHQGTSQHMVWHYMTSLVQHQYIRWVTSWFHITTEQNHR